MPVPTIDGELYSEAGFVWAEPSDKYPLGRWEAPAGAAKAGIAAVGGRVYCEHPSTEILTVSYDLVDGRGIRRWRPGQRLPDDLMRHLADPDAPIEAHNAMFERDWIELIAGPKHGWVVPAADKWRCSMATALVAQRPAALGALTEVLGIAEQKDKEGDRLIKKFCIPQQPIVGLIDKKTGRVKRPDQPARRIYPEDDPEDFERLCLYCDRDVQAEMGAMAVVPHMEPHEVVAWQLTQAMNWRGMSIDHDGLDACIDMLGKVLVRYGEECEQITGLKVTQLEKLKGWLAAYGVHTSSLDADALKALLARPDIDPTARRVLELRERTGSASVKKIFGLKNHMGRGDRIRDMLIHHGTRPGRPTGADVQPLNLPKAGPKLSRCECGKPAKPGPTCPWCGEIKPPVGRKAWESAMVDDVLEVMSLGSLSMVEEYFGDAMTAIQGCVRGLFVAADGHDLVSTDYSSLQAVVAACLAGEEWKVQAFRDRKPVYLLAASKITGTPVEEYERHAKETGDHHPDRQAGKTAELACFSPETQVLTDHGYISIKDVSLRHKLWDGVEWVMHHGLIDKGVRSVVSLDGVRMTPDHLINVRGSWKAARQLVSNENILCQALATGLANLPLSIPRTTRSKCNAPAAENPISLLGEIYGLAPLSDVTIVDAPKPALAAVKIIGATKISYRMSSIVGGYSTAFRPVSPVVVPVTRRPVREIMQPAEFGYTICGEMVLKGEGSFLRTSLHCPVGIVLNWNWIVSKQTGTTDPEIYVSLHASSICKTSDQYATYKRSSTCTSNVYDIANAGPRNRFTIKTNSGHLLVHNCGFQGWINAWRAMETRQGVHSGYEDARVREIILAWRAANPAIVEMWGGQWRGTPWRRERQELFGLEGMFIAAVQNPGQSFDYRGVGFCMEERDCLVIRLPQIDGIRRALRYHEPRLTVSARNADELSISYSTWNTNPNYGARGWVRMGTWGGRIFENVVMGVEVDIQRFGAKLMEAHGYPLVLSVYDENVAEIPKGKPLTLDLSPVAGLDPYVQEIEHLLAIMPPEIASWPIRASDGWRGRRYRKG